MKKIFSLIMIMLILFSVCSCKSKSDTEDAGQIIIDNEDTATQTDIEKENTEQTDKTEQTPEPEPKPEPQPEPEPVNTDKGNACTLTLDNTFSPYEVIITLTLEESAKGLTYTPEDFPEIDCYYVFDVDSEIRKEYGEYVDENGNISINLGYDHYLKYYGVKTYPECEYRITLSLLLNKPSKEGVLEAVKKLEQDNRVYMVEPSCGSISEFIGINLKDKSLVDLTTEDFPECKLEGYYTYDNSVDLILGTKVKDGDITDYTRYKPIYNNIKSLLKDDRIESISLSYSHVRIITDSIDIEVSRFYPSIKADDFTKEDFPYLKISHIRVSRTRDKFIDMNTIDKVYLTLSEASRQNFFDSISLLENDPRVTSIKIHYAGEVTH